MDTLRCVTLDLDDTLWDHRRAQAEALRMIAQENVSAEAVDSFVDRFYHHNRILWAQYGEGQVESAVVKSERFARALLDLGSPAENATAIGQEFLERYGRMRYLLPGTEHVLAALASRVVVGCITDGFTEVQRWKMETTGIGRHFDFVLTSEEVGVTKPHPAMYAAAVQAAGCSAAEIVHVGDSYEKDVVGAMASGMRTAWIPLPESPRGDDLDPAPNWVLSDLHELLPALGLT